VGCVIRDDEYYVQVGYALILLDDWWQVGSIVFVDGVELWALEFPIRKGERPTREEIDHIIRTQARPFIDTALAKAGYGEEHGPWNVVAEG
jgi:hypothetical protein